MGQTWVILAGEGGLGRFVGQVGGLGAPGATHAAVAVLLTGLGGLAQAGDAISTGEARVRLCLFCKGRAKNRI